MHLVIQKSKQNGSVLLEAMIAILIFSIGILALVGMQVTAVNSVSDAKYRSDANYLANQILGVMWANRISSGASCTTNVDCIPDPAYICNPCNSGQGNAATQTWAGASGVAGVLPNGTSAIAVSGNQVTITLGWLPPNAASGVTPHNHTLISNIE